MARVQVAAILEYLDYNLQMALDKAVKEQCAGMEIDSKSLYQLFVQKAKRTCFFWEAVPEAFVETE